MISLASTNAPDAHYKLEQIEKLNH